jgi:SAM-dependent methyltransferase
VTTRTLPLAPELYLAVRRAEDRLYPDAVVTTLPDPPSGTPHADEWRLRGPSARRLAEYFRQQARPLRILDLGCGNGWLSAHVADLPGCRVWGLDTNHLELAQAGRVFHRERLAFLEGDVEAAPFASSTFDAAFIASSIQYFPDLPRLVSALFQLLRPEGEVHILDSPLYDEAEVAAAREASLEYYKRLGIPEMAEHYHHHALSSLRGFEVAVLYDPRGWPRRLLRGAGRPDSPFLWLRLRATETAK